MLDWSYKLSRCSSGVERFLGKEEVGGSIPPIGSVFFEVVINN